MNAPAGPQIRPMNATDLPCILQMAQDIRNVPHWPPAAWLAALDPSASPRRIALAAEDSPTGPIQGFAVAVLLPPQAELETIAVATSARRTGIGSRLLSALLDELRQAGIREIYLEVRVSNRAALDFYRNFGFSQTGYRTSYYADPIEDAVLMSRDLS
jgi:[ribosomal protein S18]-alanine N-acetyltransferase